MTNVALIFLVATAGDFVQWLYSRNPALFFGVLFTGTGSLLFYNYVEKKRKGRN